MTEITLQDVEAKIEIEKQKGDITWHFHVLPPHCYVNPTDQVVFVYENPSLKEFYRFSQSDQDGNHGVPIEYVEHLHGIELGTTHMQNILLRAIKLNDIHYPWHIHVFFPGCVFSEHPGKWVLVLEDKKNRVVLKTVQDQEPAQEYLNLVGLYNQQMEYFEQKNASTSSSDQETNE